MIDKKRSLKEIADEIKTLIKSDKDLQKMPVVQLSREKIRDTQSWFTATSALDAESVKPIIERIFSGGWYVLDCVMNRIRRVLSVCFIYSLYLTCYVVDVTISGSEVVSHNTLRALSFL